ncbi:MAG: DUF2752 domain-containing protein [Planctomycetes bacterium]|nr:DUF2752 domain-containing protein [Planctomycetota bacterium]
MKITFAKADRLPAWPWWAVAIVAGWLGLVGLAAGMSQRAGVNVDLCPFKRLTHLPCPTCGTTRGTLCILHGRPVEGFAHNPLVFAALTVIAVGLVLRAITGRKIVLNLSPRQRIFAWAVLAVAFAANWVYVIFYVG